MNYQKFFRDLIYGSENWVVQAYASRLQQAWCTWHPDVREERLLDGYEDVMGLIILATTYPELQVVYNKYLNNEY